MWSSSENELGLKGVEPNTAHCIIADVSYVGHLARCWGCIWNSQSQIVPSPGHTNVFPASHKSGTCPFKMFLM